MKRKKFWVRMTVFALAAACLSLAACGAADAPPAEEKGKENGKTLAYVPLDDRPVNTDRVEYIAESLDYRLAMPDADLYATHLDNQKTNSNGTQYGDRDRLIEWLENTTADCYVISLDQMLSGGLVESRIHAEESMQDVYGLIDRMLIAVGEKPAVVFDSVIRLASTVGYNGYQLDVYNALREYGSQPRAQLEGEELTVENIVKGYPYNRDGAEIESDLDPSVVSEHFAARERKLRISEYYLAAVKEKPNVYTMFGIDDSSPKITIQSNEVRFLTERLKNGSFIGIDESAVMGVARLYRNYVGAAVSANVRYFGGGEKLPADEYDVGNLEDNIDNHLQSLGVTKSSAAELQILILTRPHDGLDKTYADAAKELIAYASECISSRKPVIVIEASERVRFARLQKLQGLLFGGPIGTVLAYSNWNTVSNSAGIALGNGISRYCYLKYGEVTDAGNEGFLKTLAFSYVKDWSYQLMRQSVVQIWIKQDLGGDTNNFYGAIQDESALNEKLTQTMNADYPLCPNRIFKQLSKSEYIVNLKTYRVAPFKKITVGNFSFPWYRTFEVRFDISFA